MLFRLLRPRAHLADLPPFSARGRAGANRLLSLSRYGNVMAYDPGALQFALAAAVGDDPALVAELRSAFLQSAHAHVDALGRAQSDADWRLAASRLQGLAASFGAIRLMELAESAAEGAAGDPAILRRLDSAIALFSEGV